VNVDFILKIRVKHKFIDHRVKTHAAVIPIDIRAPGT